MSKLPTASRTRLSALAGLLGAAAALGVVTGAGPVPSVFQLAGTTEDVRGSCDETEHAGDPACVGGLSARGREDSSSSSTSTTVGSSTTAAPGAPSPAGSDVRTIQAADAGSVLVAVDGASLRLLTATPDQGWQAEVERASGREVEVTFRSGTRRVDLNLELEDGQLRARVRTRDDATDTRTETTNGGADDSDHSGSDDADDSADDGSSGPGSDDSADDNSGHGSNSDDSADDNSSSGGSGSDASADDNSSSSGPGSDDSLDDNSSGSGSDDSADDSSSSGSDDGPDHT